MTDSLFKITPTPPTSIKLEPGQEGKLSFTVESLAAPDKVHELKLVIADKERPNDIYFDSPGLLPNGQLCDRKSGVRQRLLQQQPLCTLSVQPTVHARLCVQR